MPRLVFRPANEDVPLLHAPFEEDAPPPYQPPMAWFLRASVFQDAEDVGVLGLALDEEGPRNFQSYAWASPVRPVSVDDDLPVTAATLAAEDEAGPPPRSLGWPPPLPRSPLEDDTPLLYGPLEEDFFAFPKPIPLVALQQPRPPDTEDVPALHGPFEEDRWTSGVAPVQAHLWQKLPYLPDADGDGFTPSPTHVPKIANLALAQQNLAALALADAAKRNLGLAPSGQRALSLAQSGPSRLSLSSLAERFLSLIRDD